MLESVLIVLIILGFILMVLSFYWESMAFSIITLVIWMSLSISVYQVEIPYQAIDSSNNIITGTQSVENLYMFGMFFIALAAIMFLNIISIAFKIYKDREKKIM